MFSKIFKKEKVLVVGDIILDIHHEGVPLGILSENPTVVMRSTKERRSWGGAGFLVRNILTLGGSAIFVFLLGEDEYSKYIEDFTHQDLETYFIKEKARKVTVKQRFWVNKRKLLAWDHLDNRPISKDIEMKCLKIVKNNLSQVDKIIISDYRHGFLTKSLAKKLVKLAQENKKPIYIDSQVAQSSANHIWYKGADLFCLNQMEAISVDSQFSEDSLKLSMIRLAKKLDTKCLIIKLGEKGAVALFNNKWIEGKPYKVKVIDTVGAGDAFFAVFTLSSQEITSHIMKMANTWAGLSTTKAGTEIPSAKKFESIIRKKKK